jgi:hypothetical protein
MNLRIDEVNTSTIRLHLLRNNKIDQEDSYTVRSKACQETVTKWPITMLAKSMLCIFQKSCQLITIIGLTNKVSPLDSRLVIKIVDHTVHATSVKLAASFREIPVGTGRTCPSETATFSA